MQRLSRRDALRLIFFSLAAGAVSSCGPMAAEAPDPTTAPSLAAPSATVAAPAPAPPTTTGSSSPATAAATPADSGSAGSDAGGGLNTSGSSERAELGVGPNVSITPIDDFYTVAITRKTDWLKPDTYTLKVSGAVDALLTLNLDELKAFPAVDQMRTLECISNPVGGNLISNGTWKGARLKDVLEKAGLKSQAVEIKFQSADGYATSIPVAYAMDDNSLLVYEMDGGPLPDAHGAPVRCLFPGRYGMKQPKWLISIEAITQDFIGHWERQGWSNTAFVKVNSQIVTPEEGTRITSDAYSVTGLAYADISGVARVELSTDSGSTWQDAKLVHGPTNMAWTEWRYEWQTPVSGSYLLAVRATDGSGNVQPPTTGRILLPDASLDGVWSQHRVPVSVKK